MIKWRARFLILVIIGTCGALGQSAVTTTSLRVEIGWNGAFRAGRWGPIYITASDPQTRNVLIEVYVPHDQVQSMRIHQTATIGPMPRTFMLYAPLTMVGDEMSIKLRDPQNYDKLLASATRAELSAAGPRVAPMYSPQLIVAAGRRGHANHALESVLTQEMQTGCVWVDSLRLPTAPIGYDGVNLLILDRPDLAAMPVEQQEAIVDWVRAGGQLMCWLGEDALPPSGPILDVLPAVVEDNTVLEVSAPSLRATGLPPTAANLSGRQLTPRPGGEPVPFLFGEVQGLRRPLGLGVITLFPIDLSSLSFNDPANARAFWQPLLNGAIKFRDPNEKNRQYDAYEAATEQRRSVAGSKVMDLLGDIPGAGSFGFSYVAIVMLAMMLIVGPIDWIVLKKLDRQPWTWITTSGWIGLLTVGAVYMGHAFKSGDLHFRTLRVIDQADGITVATTDAIGIYSPRTGDYDLKVDNDGWWRPLSADTYYYPRGRGLSDVDFHQDRHGTRPMTMRIAVWNLRFLSGETIGPGKPVIDSSLHEETRAGKRYLVGTITNLTGGTIKDAFIRLPDLSGEIQSINLAPGATGKIDEVLVDNHPYLAQLKDMQSRAEKNEPPELGNPFALYDLAAERSARIDRILEMRANVACIYAEVEHAGTSPQLLQKPAAEQHTLLLRAVVPLQRSETP